MKPTGWVVDMRHYLDEETGNLPDGLPTPVLNLALFFGSIVAWVTDHLPHGDGIPTCPAGGVLAADAASATSRPNLTLHLDTSCGGARSAATTV